MDFYLLEYSEETEETEKKWTQPHKKYVRDSKAMACTAVDVKETPDAYQFIADMPGVDPSDVKVELENGNVLKISGQRKREEPGPDTKFLKIERRPGEFMRRFTLHKNANKETISATFKDGVLTVTVPKLPPPEPAKPRNIEVKVA